MQLLAYVTVNENIPTRVMLDYAFDTGIVADLCSYAAAKCSCPLGCSFKVSLKSSGDGILWNVPDDVAFKDGSEMHITISLPVNDYSSQLMSPARRNFSQSAPSTPGLSQNPMDNSHKRFRETKNLRNPSTPTTTGKKKKLFEPIDPGNLEAAAVALCRCSSFNETKKIVAQTAPLRCSWIKNVEQENALRIPETFMKKFPCFVGDISLLNEDYKCNMQHRGLVPVKFGEAFKNMIPAIFNLAKAKKVIPDDPTDPDGEAWLACKLLILLVPKYCKKNTTCKPDPLFVEGWDSAYLNILHQLRREMKQTAPMIFVVTAHPSNTNLYYVATDDVALKVNGTFCDVLQSLMELHYIFDLAYAKELKPFFLLLENMANLGLHHAYSTLNDLYYDLKMEANQSMKPQCVLLLQLRLL